MSEINDTLLNGLLVKSHNELDGLSLIDIRKKIDKIILEICIIFNKSEKKELQTKNYKSKLIRLNTEIQKQTSLNVKLTTLMKNDNTKDKQTCVDILNKNMDTKIRMMSVINTQTEEIKQILAETEDKKDFIDRQMRITNGDSIFPKTTLMLKRMEKDKEAEYYKSLCKQFLINGILTYNSNISPVKELYKKTKLSKKKFYYSVKSLKNKLHEIDKSKSNILLQFDGYYDEDNKTEILKLITSTFNLMISIGCMQCWRSEAEITKRKAQLWTVCKTSGKPVSFQSPFNRFATEENVKKNDGFMSLQLK
ncbi:Hypothetical protein CINCED_3A025590 [Cinara cedri]|uniref:Uncharacterized protein n=1 Tax=Cinara cedri TaxID=506608 RepID=A0A5E4N9Y6_9HEMI|nr:Hypothetical protein CINCED_3A025590 [Cinara cedri]